MNSIGLVVNIFKINHNFDTSNATFVCESLDDSKDKLINYLISQLGNLNIDYPMDLTEFENIWFKQNYVNTNAFNYFIFQDGKWIQPWELNEIYDEFLDKMIEQESSNPPDFETIYGEPNPDEEVNDNFTMEQSEDILKFEKKLAEIMTNAKNIDFKEDQIKDCDCNQCKEAKLNI